MFLEFYADCLSRFLYIAKINFYFIRGLIGVCAISNNVPEPLDSLNE